MFIGPKMIVGWKIWLDRLTKFVPEILNTNTELLLLFWVGYICACFMDFG